MIIPNALPQSSWSGLRANDAIHLATARQMEVAEFHTYDGQLSRYEEVLGFPICEPRRPDCLLAVALASVGR